MSEIQEHLADMDAAAGVTALAVDTETPSGGSPAEMPADESPRPRRRRGRKLRIVPADPDPGDPGVAMHDEPSPVQDEVTSDQPSAEEASAVEAEASTVVEDVATEAPAAAVEESAPAEGEATAGEAEASAENANAEGAGEAESAEASEAEPSGADALLGDQIAPEISTEQVIEAILFAADTPIPLPKIVSVLGVGSAREVKKYIESLNRKYEQTGASFRIEKIAGGYQMLTLPQFNTWLRRLRQTRQESKFSAAALETLAVVAYKQPVVRAEIEAIRGVSAGEMLNRLREMGLIKIVGRAEDVGRPMMYGTTKKFLEVFGLSSLEDLPQVEQLQMPE